MFPTKGLLFRKRGKVALCSPRERGSWLGGRKGRVIWGGSQFADNRGRTREAVEEFQVFGLKRPFNTNYSRRGEG